MILEGIVTTSDAAGDLNVAPMGPIVDESLTSLLLRPFQSSTTYRNLQRQPYGVLHVVDDVLLLAEAAIGQPAQTPTTFEALTIPGRVLASACRWYEFQVERLDDSQARTEIRATVTHSGRLRDVFGFNRAKHAVIEAAILATRVHLPNSGDVSSQYESLRTIVEKTAGPRESQAFELLQRYVDSRMKETGDGVAN